MMNLSLVDLHCDTVYELYAHHKSFEDPTLAIQLLRDCSDVYQSYLQVTAIWSDQHLSDEEAFRQCLRMLKLFHRDFLRSPNRLIPAVEDARLLGGDLDRLEILYQNGVRFLTLLWKGCSCIGGAYDTDDGLTPFGKRVVSACARLGIVADISHASIQSAYDTLEQAVGKPVIASHSDSFSVFPHPRNLTDELFEQIRACYGLVGINLYQEHLGIGSLRGSAIDVILRHVDHFLSLGGEDNLCFGCDFDGAVTPSELRHPQDLIAIAEEMLCRGYSQTIIEKLFWKNAEAFIENNILI